VIVVDTSAWVEFLRSTRSKVDRRLTEAIRSEIPLGVPDIVRLELLAGAGSEAAAGELSRLLARFTALPASSPADHDLGAALYREVRRTGQTVRSLVDCLVAATALRLDLPVLARDKDFELLAAISALRLEPG